MLYIYQLVRTRRLPSADSIVLSKEQTETTHPKTEQVLCLIDAGWNKNPSWYTLDKTLAESAKVYHQCLFPDKEFEILSHVLTSIT